jgi:glutathionylspermidine synthase
MGKYKEIFKAQYKEEVANMSNEELYKIYLDVANNIVDSDDIDLIMFQELRTEFEFRLKTCGFLNP